MEKRRKNARSDDSTVKGSNNEKLSSSQITMDLFLVKCVRDGTLKPWQPKEIAAFFRDLKLRDKEDLEVYEETLKKY